MTDLEKRIYNKHLAISKILRNAPFKKREKFDNFEEDLRYIHVKRISVFLAKYPEVNIDEYFTAPYKVYPDVKYFDLAFFSSPRGIKAYSLYRHELALKSPDTQKESVLDSIRFIGLFCLERCIPLDKYVEFRSSSIEPEWMYHVRKNKINFYSLMEFHSYCQLLFQLALSQELFYLIEYFVLELLVVVFEAVV